MTNQPMNIDQVRAAAGFGPLAPEQAENLRTGAALSEVSGDSLTALHGQGVASHSEAKPVSGLTDDIRPNPFLDAARRAEQQALLDLLHGDAVLPVLWIDIETTGLKPKKHAMLEIALVVTDRDLHVLDTYEAVIGFTPATRWHKVARAMAEKSGLATICQHPSCRAIDEIVPDVVEFLLKWFPTTRPVLGGSSVQFDRGFVTVHLPELIEKVHPYRNVDVSSVKELAKHWAPEVYDGWVEGPRSYLHRAMPDVLETLSELRHYQSSGFIGLAGPGRTGEDLERVRGLVYQERWLGGEALDPLDDLFPPSKPPAATGFEHWAWPKVETKEAPTGPAMTPEDADALDRLEDIETFASFLADKHCSTWGKSFQIHDDKSRLVAAAWLIDQVIDWELATEGPS